MAAEEAGAAEEAAAVAAEEEVAVAVAAEVAVAGADGGGGGGGGGGRLPSNHENASHKVRVWVALVEVVARGKGDCPVDGDDFAHGRHPVDAAGTVQVEVVHRRAVRDPDDVRAGRQRPNWLAIRVVEPDLCVLIDAALKVEVGGALRVCPPSCRQRTEQARERGRD